MHYQNEILRDGLAKPWAPLSLRLILGTGFLVHGAPKLFSLAGHESFVGMLQGMGIPAPELMAWVVGGVEVVGGISLILGSFVLLWSALLTANMLVAITVHLPHGFSFINVVETTAEGPVFGMPGYEVNLLYMAGLVSLALMGAGPLSFDRALAERLEEEARAAALSEEPLPTPTEA